MNKDHYSYRIYEQNDVAEHFESDRFGGPVGKYLKECQEHNLLDKLQPTEQQKFLDVGGGSGRISIPIARQGSQVILLDSSFAMLRVAGKKLHGNSTMLLRVQGDAHDLPIKSRSIDGVIMIRVLMHVINWKKVLHETCRVTKEVLIVDFARKNSFATIESIFRKIQSWFSKDVQVYRTYSLHEISKYIEQEGFQVSIHDPGFFLPLRFYRILKSSKLIVYLESIFKKVGLSRGFGSPVTILAKRNNEHENSNGCS